MAFPPTNTNGSLVLLLVVGGGCRDVARVGDRSSVVSANKRLVVLIGSSTSDSGASVSGIVRGTDIMSCGRDKVTSASSSNFGVAKGGVLVLATSEEATTATTASVVVGRAGTEALLLSAVTDQHKLKQHRQQEEEAITRN